MGRLNPSGENKIKGKNGDRERDKNKKKHREEEDIGAQTEAARQSRAALLATERKEESSTCAWTRDHTCHAQSPDDGGG